MFEYVAWALSAFCPSSVFRRPYVCYIMWCTYLNPSTTMLRCLLTPYSSCLHLWCLKMVNDSIRILSEAMSESPGWLSRLALLLYLSGKFSILFFSLLHNSGVLFVCFRLSCSLAQQGLELLTIFLSHPIKHLDNSYTPPDLAIFSQAQFIEKNFSWMFLSMAILLIILKMFLLPVSWGKTINCSQMVLGWNSIHHISWRIHLRICIWIITYTQLTWNKLIPQF